MTVTLVKLAFSGIRSRLLASALTVFLSSAAAATIVLALEVGGTARDPWQRTFDAANGAHVLADVASQADADAIAMLPGVAERGEPVPHAGAGVASGGGADRLLLDGLSSPARVNAPVRTEGTAPPADGIVLERSFSDALGLRVGGTLRLAGTGGPVELPIVGTAISPSQPPYPRRNPGLAWVTRATLERIEPDRSRWRWTQAPADGPRRRTRLRHACRGIATARDRLRGDLAGPARQRAARRATDRGHPHGLHDRAACRGLRGRGDPRRRACHGAAPRDRAAEGRRPHAAPGDSRVRARIGRTRPDRGRHRLHRRGAPRPAARRAQCRDDARLTNDRGKPVASARRRLPGPARPRRQRALVDPAHHPLHRPARDPVRCAGARLAIAARACDRAHAAAVPLALGLKDLLARRRRALRLGGAIVVTGAAVVFALSMQATLDARPAGEASDVPDELPVLVYTLDVVLLVITVTTLVAIALLSVRERIRDYGVLKTMGLTPRQIASSLVSAHAAVALIAALLSIPAGIGLYMTVYAIAGADSKDLVIARWWWLALVPIATVLLVAAATSLPARLATRIPAADALRYE